MHDIQIASFLRGLADTGFAEGRNVSVEYRFAQGQSQRLPELAADLVRREVSVLVAAGTTPGALAAKAATQTIPIVFVVGTDPVEVGLVPSLARPGGNITGVTNVVSQLIAKCFELAHFVVPSGSTIAVFVNSANVPQSEAERREIQTAARVLGNRALIVPVSNPSEIEQGFVALHREKVAALVVSGETLFLTQSPLIVSLAAQGKVPAIYAYSQSAEAGGLMSYGASITEEHRLGGVYAGRILKGAKPADLPVQQSSTIELVVNLKTANTLDLKFPETVFLRATRILE
jgi:putative ABC transport system substrate-binding protein